MAVASACFKWADVLENQFDKSWVELDTILCQLEDDEVRNHGIILITFNSDLMEDFWMLHLQSTSSLSSSPSSSLLSAGLRDAAPAINIIIIINNIITTNTNTICRTLGCCTCRAGELPPRSPPASPSSPTSQPQSSRLCCLSPCHLSFSNIPLVFKLSSRQALCWFC